MTWPAQKSLSPHGTEKPGPRGSLHRSLTRLLGLTPSGENAGLQGTRPVSKTQRSQEAEPAAPQVDPVSPQVDLVPGARPALAVSTALAMTRVKELAGPAAHSGRPAPVSQPLTVPGHSHYLRSLLSSPRLPGVDRSPSTAVSQRWVEARELTLVEPATATPGPTMQLTGRRVLVPGGGYGDIPFWELLEATPASIGRRAS